ncbi:MAG: SDR family oxidoreductase [Bacteroidota bacterium]
MKKSVLVTGTSSGFGKLTVETLAKDGHKVFATMRGVNGKNAEAAKGLSDWAKEHNLNVHVIELDVTSDASVKAAADEVMSKADTIDVVVNNAGIYAGGFNETYTAEDFQRIYDVNTFGPLRVSNAFLPYMRKQGNGLLIHVTTIMASVNIPFSGVYTSSKYAADAIAESYRYELAPFGIDSVIIQPGAFPTEILGKVYEPSNGAVGEQYGPVMGAVEKVQQAFANMFEGEAAQNPQDVADAVKKLIDTPAGERPLRTVVDKLISQGPEAVNNVTNNVQKQLLNSMNLAELESVKNS